MAICCRPNYDRAKDGQQDYMLTGWLVQPADMPLTMAEDPATPADRDVDAKVYAGRCRFGLFRPFKKALPDVQEGDVLLLRNLKVEQFAGEPFLRSKDDSGWGVITFPEYAYSAAALQYASEGDDAAFVSEASVTAAGPPVEYGEDEVAHALKLKRWYEHYGKLVKELPEDES